jgi:hypothetical protein
MKMLLDVDGVQVCAWTTEGFHDEMIFNVQCGLQGQIRVNVIKTFDKIPINVVDNPVVLNLLALLYKDWMTHWPAGGSDSWRDIDLATFEENQVELPLSYMSEELFVEAIEAAIHSVTVWS